MDRIDARIVADDKIPFLAGVLEPYFREVVYRPGAKTTPDDVRDAVALITRTRTKCDAALLAGSRVRLVVSATIGYDHLDTAYLDAAGIAWSNAPGCNSGSVKQYLTAALLAVARKHGIELAGKTLGVVGVGQVGGKVAAAAAALGMRVLLNDPPRADREGAAGFVGLEAILRESDFVTLHVPLDAGGPYPTFHLADTGFFAALRPGAVFFNSSRGEVCDGDALKGALNCRRLTAAVLDVWEQEPEIDRELLGLLDFATPHIAGYSANGKANGTAQCVNLIGRTFQIPELADWYPDNVPVPEEPFIDLPSGASPLERAAVAVAATYDLARDDRELRRDPSRFEELRGGYPVRLEFQSYQVRPESAEEAACFAALGFQLR